MRQKKLQQDGTAVDVSLFVLGTARLVAAATRGGCDTLYRYTPRVLSNRDRTVEQGTVESDSRASPATATHPLSVDSEKNCPICPLPPSNHSSEAFQADE